MAVWHQRAPSVSSTVRPCHCRSCALLIIYNAISVQDLITEYLALYNTTTPSWGNVTTISDYLNFSGLVAQTTEAYLDAQNINKKYSSEMIEGAINFTFKAYFTFA